MYWLSKSPYILFVTNEELHSCWPRKRLPLPIASPAIYHTEIIFGWKTSDCTSHTGQIDSKIAHVDNKLLQKANHPPFLLHFRCFRISVNKFWELIIRLGMYKGYTCHGKGLDPISSQYTTSKGDIVLTFKLKWQSTRSYTVKISKNILCQWCHTILCRSGQCAMWTQMNHNHYAALIQAANCITHYSHLVHMVEILDSSYGTSYKSMRSSWTKKRWSSCATLIKKKWIDLYAVNCHPKVLTPNWPMSFFTQIKCVLMTLQMLVLKPFGS